jgi:hypothetical protein
MASILIEDPSMEWVIAAGARPAGPRPAARADHALKIAGLTMLLIDCGSSSR